MKKCLSIFLILTALLLVGCGGGEVKISQERAKEIALESAGIKAEDVHFIRVEKDRDDGRTVYEIEFRTKDGMEYDYEIDAETGNIISYDTERKGKVAQQQIVLSEKAGGQQSETETAVKKESLLIPEDRAKEIALEKVPGATTENIVQFKKDYEDGKDVYEGKIIYNNTEYEFEIDAQTGNVNEWESETIG